jgi:hypothetical protein
MGRRERRENREESGQFRVELLLGGGRSIGKEE